MNFPYSLLECSYESYFNSIFSVIFTFNSYAINKWLFIDEGWQGNKFYVYKDKDKDKDKDKIKKDRIFLSLYNAVNYKKCNGTNNYPCSALLFTKFNCKKNISLDLRLIGFAKHNFGGKVVYEKQTGENENENWVD